MNEAADADYTFESTVECARCDWSATISEGSIRSAETRLEALLSEHIYEAHEHRSVS